MIRASFALAAAATALVTVSACVSPVPPRSACARARVDRGRCAGLSYPSDEWNACVARVETECSAQRGTEQRHDETRARVGEGAPAGRPGDTADGGGLASAPSTEAPSPGARPERADGGSPPESVVAASREPGAPPSEDEVGAAVLAATPKALAACGLSESPLLTAASLEVKTDGSVAKVETPDTLRFVVPGVIEHAERVPAVGSAAARACLAKAYAGLSFPAFTLPPSTRGPAYRCPDAPGGRSMAMFHPEKYCTPVVADSRTFTVDVMLDGSGGAKTPTAQEARDLAARDAGDRKAAACAATKASGIPAGVYAGERRRTHVAPAEGDDVAPGTVCKVSEWRSLHLVVEESGCASWYGLWNDDFACSGNAARNEDVIPYVCIEEGSATVSRSGTAYSLNARVTSRGAGPTPIRYHLWKCPGLGVVRTDRDADMTSSRCVRMGSDVEPREERGANAACQLSRAYDDDLAGAQLAIDRDGTLRVTMKDRSTFVLHHLDRK